jgi:hypothetical protein
LFAIAKPIFSCNDIDTKLSAPKTSVVKDNLTILISNYSLKKNNIDVNEDESVQNFFSIEFFNFFKKKENWDNLKIKSSGAEFYLLNCNGEKNYLMQIPMKNIQITKLSESSKKVHENYFEEFSVENLGRNELNKFK